jgi:hypothetical protein
LPNHRHDYLTIRVDAGSIKYRTHVLGGNWLDWVAKGDRNDLANGAAGNTGQPIDGVQVYYTTPACRRSNKHGTGHKPQDEQDGSTHAATPEPASPASTGSQEYSADH